MKEPKREHIPIPRIHQDIKAMNGKSSKRLSECIDVLTDLLDDNEAQNEEVVEQPDTMPDTE